MFKKGDKVNYLGEENGIVVSVSDRDKVTRTKMVYVVYQCDDWDNYEAYPRQATFYKDLRKGWV